MFFSSYLFLFFFLPAALLGYYAVPRRWKHLVWIIFTFSVFLLPGYAEVSAKNEKIKTCVVEGVVESVSQMPSPDSSNYPNCNFTCVFRIKQIIAGEAVPVRLVLIFQGFREYKDIGNKIAVKDLLNVEITPLELMPESFRQTQLADDNENFELQYFAAVKFEKKKNFSLGNFLAPLTEKKQLWWKKPLNPALSSDSRKIRAKQMEKNLKKAKEELKLLQQNLPEHEKIIQEFCRNNTKQPVHCWHNDCFFGFSPNSFYIGNPWVQASDEHYYHTTIPQIKALNHFFKFHNIDFVVCILPSPDEVAIGAFIPTVKGYRKKTNLKLTIALLHAGIDAVDLYDETILHLYDYPLIFQYHRNNDHPHTGMCAIAGKYLADYLSQRAYIKKHPMAGEIVPCSDSYFTNLWSVENGRFPLNSPAPLSKIKWLNNEKKAEKEILIAGNSYSTYPISNGTIGDFLSFYGHAPYDWIGGENGASSIPAKLLNSGETLLKGKKVAVLFVAVGHLLDPSFQDMDLLTQTTRIATIRYEQNLIWNAHDSGTENRYKIPITIPEHIPPKKILALKVHLSSEKNSPWGIAEIKENVKQNFAPRTKSTVLLKLAKRLHNRNFEIGFYYPNGYSLSGKISQIDFYLTD